MGQAPSLPDVSVIIVNWNSREFLRQCLRTVFQHAGDLQFEVIVIDNASYDGSEPMVWSEFPQVVFIQGDENVGFARANNAAATQASGRNLLFLNPDTEVSDGAIETMARFMDATPEAGAVGCRLLNTDGSLQTSCVQAFPTDPEPDPGRRGPAPPPSRVAALGNPGVLAGPRHPVRSRGDLRRMPAGAVRYLPGGRSVHGGLFHVCGRYRSLL